MADPMTYDDPDKYIIVNPDNPKVVHQTWDAPLVDPETKNFITDDQGRIKVIRCINFGTKGLTQSQVDARIETKNADLIAHVNTLDNTISTFLTGEPDDNDTVDRLSELVQYIQSHQDTVDSLTNTYLAISDFDEFKNTVVTTDYLDERVNRINTTLEDDYLTYNNITDDLGSQETNKAPTAKNLSNISTHLLQVARELLTARSNLQDLTNEVNLLKSAVITGGGTGTGTGAGAVVVTIPTIIGSNAVIGVNSRFVVAAKPLLVGGQIVKFFVTLTGCEAQTVEADENGQAVVYFRLPEDGTVQAGQQLSMSVMATDNAGNNSQIVTKEIMANAKPEIIDPDDEGDPTVDTPSSIVVDNSGAINAPEVIFISDENTISNVNDVRGEPYLVNVNVLPLPEDYATRGLNTSVVYLSDI